MISLKELNSKIKSLMNTGKITKAMKLIAANRLTKSKKSLQGHGAYAEALGALLNALPIDLSGSVHRHPLLKPKKESDVTSIRLLLITSQRGLCGPYNSNAIRLAQNTIQSWQQAGKSVALQCFGKKGFEAFRSLQSITSSLEEAGRGEHANMDDAIAVASELTDRYLKGDADAIYLLYHDFASAVRQVPVLECLLPFSMADAVSASNEGDSSNSLLGSVICEPNNKSVLETLIAKAVENQIHRAFLNAQASEHASRMTAMDNATRNGEEMIEDYTLLKNRVRQASITTELSEVVSGAEALKG